MIVLNQAIYPISHRYGNSVLPKAPRLKQGEPSLDLPFDYSHSRTQAFFDRDPWFMKGKINLPDCFGHVTTFGGSLMNKIALCEG